MWVTILRNKSNGLPRYGSNQFQYAMIYILVTFAVLLFLNIYTSKTSQTLFYRSKQSSMQDKAQLVASAISEQDVVNPQTVKTVIDDLDNLKATRLIVTNQTGLVLYDSMVRGGSYGIYNLFPETVSALRGNEVFTCTFSNGIMESRAASPIFSYGTLNGCVYIMEHDPAQGHLLGSLELNMFSITFCLELFVIMFSFFFAKAFSRRMREIIASIQIIRQGDYTHKVELTGHDEVTLLGSQFNELTDRLYESEKRRQQFVSDASHELKTPLASIKLLADSILQNDMDLETIREFVTDIGDEADRLNRMSYKLLSLTKADAVDSRDCEIVYIGPTISRVVRMLSVIADQAAVSIRTDIQQDSSILVREDDLYQIIFNLVENGIKYNVPGGRLYITLTREEDNAILTIRDTGVGIPEASIHHIFERFYRVDKARARQTGGSGLGLAIVHDMVERNNGTIHVQSLTGENSGTTFTLNFPIFDVEEDKP